MARSILVTVITCLTCLGCVTHTSTHRREKGDVNTYSRVTEGTEPGTQVVLPQTQARLNNVGFLTPGLNRRVAVQGSGANRTATNTLEVWATFRNRTDFQQKLNVRTQYFHEDRSPAEGPDAWQSVFLPPNSIQTYKTFSSGTDAAYYYIEIMDMP
ncbi:MAG: hypothetical protein KJ052_11050 [Candidatus Hydrogenedentes bacterium]|nr:hypothetical protein [Candidatus Hydrogenedentota bacterium]